MMQRRTVQRRPVQRRTIPNGLLLAAVGLIGWQPADAWGQSAAPVSPPAVASAATEFSLRLRQTLFNAQRQLPWLEQDVSRSQAIAAQARQQLEVQKKELAILAKAIEDLKSAESKTQAALTVLETKSKEQRDALKKAEEGIAPNPAAEKEKADKLDALRKKASLAHQTVETLLGQIRGFEQAIQYNVQRRTALTDFIGQLDGQLRSKREAELQASSRVDDAAGEKAKLQSELERLEKQAAEQRDALKTALKTVQEVSAKSKEQASAIRDIIGKPSSTTTSATDIKPVAPAEGKKTNEEKTAAQEPVENKPADDKLAKSKPAEASAEKPTEKPTGKTAEKPAENISADKPIAATPTAALAEYQAQVAKLQEAYQQAGQRNQAAQTTLQQLMAGHAAIAQADAKMRDANAAKTASVKATQSAKETLAASEKEMEKLTEATTVLRDKLAELKKKVENSTTEATQADKELAELNKQLTAPISLQDQLSLKTKTEAAETAKRDFVQIEQQLAAEKAKLEQSTRAIEFNTQLHTKLKWEASLGEEVAAIRELEHATTSAAFASAKQAAEALAASLQKHEQAK